MNKLLGVLVDVALPFCVVLITAWVWWGIMCVVWG